MSPLAAIVGLLVALTLIQTLDATPVTTKTFCKKDPEKDLKARHACSWILDRKYPFQQCMNAFDSDKVKEFYLMCVTIFCEKGELGVCEFADNLADICEEKFERRVVGRPDFCVVTTTTANSFCVDEPAHDENAIEACSWILDVTSPYHDCITVVPLEKKKQFYLMCVNIYCEKGKVGVCDFADNVADICKENFKVVVDGRPDFCDMTTTPSGFCTKEPAQDPKAIKACGWVLDTDSPYYECIQSFPLDKIKEFYTMCLTIFCDKGEPGVCDFAENMADICEEKFEVVFSGRPDFCVATKPWYCTEIPAEDPEAIAACSWVIDRDSTFEDCMVKFGLAKAKDLMAECEQAFCEGGRTGVCVFANSLENACSDNPALPDFC